MAQMLIIQCLVCTCIKCGCIFQVTQPLGLSRHTPPSHSKAIRIPSNRTHIHSKHLATLSNSNSGDRLLLTTLSVIVYTLCLYSLNWIIITHTRSIADWWLDMAEFSAVIGTWYLFWELCRCNIKIFPVCHQNLNSSMLICGKFSLPYRSILLLLFWK